MLRHAALARMLRHAAFAYERLHKLAFQAESGATTALALEQADVESVASRPKLLEHAGDDVTAVTCPPRHHRTRSSRRRT